MKRWRRPSTGGKPAGVEGGVAGGETGKVRPGVAEKRKHPVTSTLKGMTGFLAFSWIFELYRDFVCFLFLNVF